MRSKNADLLARLIREGLEGTMAPDIAAVATATSHRPPQFPTADVQTDRDRRPSATRGRSAVHALPARAVARPPSRR